MKLPALLLLATLGCSPGLDLQAEEIAEIASPGEREKALLTAAQIDELLAPIALYPDPLVAIILPAATFPTEVVMAARYLKANGDPEAIDNQPWDDSVKALARYPDVVKWMDENLAWTQQVGAAFLVQPSAVLTGTQRLRATAVAAGNLKDTPQQTVVVEREVIRIVPAQREVIYVPVYDPVWVYRPCPVAIHYPAPLITFGIGCRTGVWLSYGCDWGYNAVVVINRPQRSVIWNSYPSWHYPRPVIVQNCQVWRPAPARVQVVYRDYTRRADYRVAHPTPNSHVQHAPERASPPRAVASTGSVTSSPRPAVRRDSGAVPSPAPATRTGPAVAATPATPAAPVRSVRNPPTNPTRQTPTAPVVSTPRPASPDPLIVRNETRPRPADRPVVTAPTGTRPERTRSAAPVQVADADTQLNASRTASSASRPERIRATDTRTTDAAPMRSPSSNRAASRPDALTGTLADADVRAARGL